VVLAVGLLFADGFADNMWKRAHSDHEGVCVSGQAPDKSLASPGSGATPPGPLRIAVAALLAFFLTLVFAGALSSESWSFWPNFTGEFIGFSLAGWVVARVGRERAGLAVLLGVGIFWLLLILLFGWRLPLRDSVAVVTYVAAAVATAQVFGQRRSRRTDQSD
jgi:hypothetical protein